MYYIFVTFFTTRRPCHYLCSHNGWVFLKCATIGTHFRPPSDEQLQHRDISCNKNLLSVSFEYDTLLTSPHIQVTVEKNVKDKNSGIYLQKLLNKLTNTIIPTTETSQGG